MADFGIIGSGFGLYGYLPALCQCDHRVLLPIRYLQRFECREELAQYSRYVKWVQSEDLLLAESDGLVLALPPKQQAEYLAASLLRENILYLLLEKPLAQTPHSAIILLDDLIGTQKRFRINYLFRYTNWARQLKATLKGNNGATTLTINWQFMAHHYRSDLSTWKRSYSGGGGVIRYYGIHLISLLSEMGYNGICSSRAFGVSTDDISKWAAVLNGPGLPKCNLYLDSRSEIDVFEVRISSDDGLALDRFILQNRDPFDQESPVLEAEDRRVPFLIRLCRTIDLRLEDELQLYHLYDLTNRLWRNTESITVYDMYDLL